MLWVTDILSCTVKQNVYSLKHFAFNLSKNESFDIEMQRFQSDTAIPTDVSYFHIFSFTENAVAQTVSRNTENRLEKWKTLSFRHTHTLISLQKQQLKMTVLFRRKVWCRFLIVSTSGSHNRRLRLRLPLLPLEAGRGWLGPTKRKEDQYDTKKKSVKISHFFN